MVWGARFPPIGPSRVVVTLIRSCGECAFCVEGNEVFCERAFSLDARDVIHDHAGHGLHQAMRTGAFAEEVVVHASQAVVIPPDMPYDVASLIACGVLTGFGAVTNTAGVRRGESVAVIGTGGVGINTLQAARHVGASPVIAIDLSEDRRTLYVHALFVDDPEGFAGDPEIESEPLPVDDGWIDLGNTVRDAMLLGLPLAPLCDPDCPGPDPEAHPVGLAGSGPGTQGLDDDDRVPDPRWSALSQLDLGGEKSDG